MISLIIKLIPPRGCAFVEFVDRKTAAKCLDRMKDDYRLDGNHIKVYFNRFFNNRIMLDYYTSALKKNRLRGQQIKASIKIIK